MLTAKTIQHLLCAEYFDIYWNIQKAKLTPFSSFYENNNHVVSWQAGDIISIGNNII